MKHSTRQKLVRIKEATEAPAFLLTSICLTTAINGIALVAWPSVWTAASATMGLVLIALDARLLMKRR